VLASVPANISSLANESINGCAKNFNCTLANNTITIFGTVPRPSESGASPSLVFTVPGNRTLTVVEMLIANGGTASCSFQVQSNVASSNWTGQLMVQGGTTLTVNLNPGLIFTPGTQLLVITGRGCSPQFTLIGTLAVTVT